LTQLVGMLAHILPLGMRRVKEILFARGVEWTIGILVIALRIAAHVRSLSKKGLTVPVGPPVQTWILETNPVKKVWYVHRKDMKIVTSVTVPVNIVAQL